MSRYLKSKARMSETRLAASELIVFVVVVVFDFLFLSCRFKNSISLVNLLAKITR
jgi:hypothetical protein